jgi:hypothetical protein
MSRFTTEQRDAIFDEARRNLVDHAPKVKVPYREPVNPVENNSSVPDDGGVVRKRLVYKTTMNGRAEPERRTLVATTNVEHESTAVGHVGPRERAQADYWRRWDDWAQAHIANAIEQEREREHEFLAHLYAKVLDQFDAVEQKINELEKIFKRHADERPTIDASAFDDTRQRRQAH